jgi:hypothetical protein
MDLETEFEAAIIQADLKKVRCMVYTRGVKITSHHIKLVNTMKYLCEHNRYNSLYDPVADFIYQEYLPPVKLNWFQKLFGIHVDFTKMNL